jgi:uncharacterized protein involved in type VI secretion and phage assembly
MTLSFPSDRAGGQETIFGVVVGLVTKTTGDPDKLNRIQVQFPTLDIGSAWARVASFAAGPNRGAFFMPAQDDEVLIAFEQGDTTRPYVIGMLWNGVDPPPVAAEKVQTVRTIKTSSGAYLEFDDTDGGTSVKLTDKNNNILVIDTKNNAITITSTKDLSLSAPSGKITLSAGSVEISATSGGLTLSATEGATLKAGGDVTVTGSMIKLN